MKYLIVVFFFLSSLTELSSQEHSGMPQYILELNEFTSIVLNDVSPSNVTIDKTLELYDKIINSLAWGDHELGFAFFKNALFDYRDTKILLSELKLAVLKFRNRLYEKEKLDKRALKQFFKLGPRYKKSLYPPLSVEAVSKHYRVTPVPHRVVREYTSQYDNLRYRRMVVGEYTWANHPFINEVIHELKLERGKIYQIEDMNLQTGEMLHEIDSFFFINDSGIPSINTNFHKDYALSGLAHEYEHFKSWKNKRDGFLERGFIPKEASLQAKQFFLKTKNRIEDEKKALSAELQMEAKENGRNSVFNRGYFAPPLKGRTIYYISRINYPNNEGIRDALYDYTRDLENELDYPFVTKLFMENLKETLAARNEIHAYYYKLSKEDEITPLEREYARYHLIHLSNINIFNTIFLDDIDRFKNNGTYKLLKSFFYEFEKSSSDAHKLYPLSKDEEGLLIDYLKHLANMIRWSQTDPFLYENELLKLIKKHKRVCYIIGPRFATFTTTVNKYRKRQIDMVIFGQELQRLKDGLLQNKYYLYEGIEQIFHSYL